MKYNTPTSGLHNNAARLFGCTFLCILLLIPSEAACKDLSNLYSQDTLAYWHGRYPKNIQYNFENVIFPILKSDERARFRQVRLEYPLVGTGGDPLEFYAYSSWGTPVVALPILSVKFFDDLAIAWAWLIEHGYSVETVIDYVDMLKYGTAIWFPGNRYPDPRTALQIPESALNDRSVDDLSQKILKSAIIWILAHELGHVYYRHPGYGQGVTPAQAQKNEGESDQFATDIMRRIGVAPIGLAIYLTMAVHWAPNRSDFPSDAAWNDFSKTNTHPLTAHRMRVLAERIRAGADDFARKENNPAVARAAVNRAANDVEGLAELLDDALVQKSIKVRAHCLRHYPNALSPRTPQAVPPPDFVNCLKQNL